MSPRRCPACLFEVVEAAASPSPDGATVDAAAVFAPAVPGITTRLAEVGVPLTEEQVAAAVADLDPIVVRQPHEQVLVGPESEVASKLGTAAGLAVVAMLIAGWAYVGVSLDKRKAVRSLLNRFALGALSFAIFLRIGSWILDPGGGRAPLMESLGLLAASKWLVPLAMGVVAGVGALRLPDLQAATPGQTGGRSPFAQRTAHTAIRMTPVPMSTALSTLGGIGPTFPLRRRRNQTHPAAI